jgi:hypothetical protein
MSGLPELKTGVYRHWRGPLYEVSGYIHDANIEGRVGVLYRSLELTGAHEGPRWAFRNVDGEDAFFDWVDQATGNEWQAHVDLHEDPINCSCTAVRRFEYLGPDFVKEMLDVIEIRFD